MARSTTGDDGGTGTAAGTASGGGPGTSSGSGSAASVPERLLAEATRLFAERGYDRTSVQEIVEAAGVTKGALYHYFGSKDDLLHEIYGRVLRLQTERLDAIAAREGDVRERLAEAAADVVVTSIQNLDDTKIFFRSMHQLSPEKQKAVRAERRRYHERFRSLVEEGQRDGHFRPGLRPDLVVDFFFGSVHHLGTWYHADGPLSAEQVATEFSDLLLHSVRQP
ncbi:TetR/AcrR family transcriptional regulator [Streptomyces cocklensis]|nr:TetR/AcrR family transcriptional regulator [Actinacidiphila cocklensis]MDD1060711.1 TetR/AcrR family transcriptional regulator [Actinacidiphila cocklensis]WSX73768.1 TetR/AcrR family transcriptional regulator [Streptomyces sp. NBC_00899]WSX80169.1 TetR/AcrR family transcriptional regulator [Streptomyces sp. NBC_00899]